MENLTPELIAKARAAKSTEELLELAKENGVEITEEEAKTFYEQLHTNGAVADDELEAVAGGGCNVFEQFFRLINRSNDNGRPYSDNKPNQPITPDKPIFDSNIRPLPHSNIKPLPHDLNEKTNHIEFL